jgi:protein TonB
MGGRQRASVTLTVVLEAMLVGTFITIPVMATDVLPIAPEMMGAFVSTQPPPPAPPPPPRSSSPAKAVEVVSVDAAPTEAPPEIAAEAPPVGNPAEHGEPGGVPGGVDGPGSVIGGQGIGEPQPPPNPAPTRQAVRVGGNIQPPRKVKDVRPVYPSIAIQARKEGPVILEATIDITGKVTGVRVLRSQPLLDQAAIDAVRQWEFTPTLLNGEPTAVIMNVTVNFQLN